MLIMIIQSEIEEAIAAHILGQMSISDDCELRINLQATRGDEGYTANIDVVAKEVTKPATARKASARKTPVVTGVSGGEETTSDSSTATQTADEPEAESQEADVSSNGTTGSIFGNLRKPVNEPAEA